MGKHAEKPLISICIPAFKRTGFLERVLDSIAIQTFTNYEVIITDDSPGDDVNDFCQRYKKKFALTYYRNEQNLNTPENWNEAIRKANGTWIKLMHDDDWFSESTSLQAFADAAMANTTADFIFSAYTNVYEDSGKAKTMFLRTFWKIALAKEPNVLISENVIGPPSVVMHKKITDIIYDHAMKYVVDIDFYIRYLNQHSFYYIREPLIMVGINQAQVTKYTFGVADVHLKEALLLLKKTGDRPLKNLIVFDGWWRLMRNFSITDSTQLKALGYNDEIPPMLTDIIHFKKGIPAAKLRNGVFSKLYMSVAYARSRLRNG